jgi:hypothetical protein
MPGKHRKPSRRRSGRGRWGSGLTAVAISTTSLTTALATGTTTTVAAPSVELAALITPANSTSQIFASSGYYGVNWPQQYGQPQVVPFFLGQQGIVDAVDRNTGDPTGIVVLSSGWGAGQTSTAMATIHGKNDPAASDMKLVILDNNTNRAGGGFWTTYSKFAPLLLTSADPPPSDTNLPIVDTAYEYNINSNAVTYPLNFISDINSLVAYAFNYGGESSAPMPPEALDPVTPGTQHYHYVVAPDGAVADKIPVNGNITYVTFQSDGLPLVRALRFVPGGDILADAVEPALTEVVNWGYQDNKPIPDDPGVTRPMGLLPPASQTAAAAGRLPGALRQGLQAAKEDVASPNSVLQQTNSTASSSSTQAVDTTTGNKVSPTSGTPGASGAANNPLQRVIGGFSSAVAGVVGGLTGGAQKATANTTTSGATGSSN